MKLSTNVLHSVRGTQLCIPSQIRTRRLALRRPSKNGGPHLAAPRSGRLGSAVAFFPPCPVVSPCHPASDIVHAVEHPVGRHCVSHIPPRHQSQRRAGDGGDKSQGKPAHEIRGRRSRRRHGINICFFFFFSLWRFSPPSVVCFFFLAALGGSRPRHLLFFHWTGLSCLASDRFCASQRLEVLGNYLCRCFHGAPKGEYRVASLHTFA